MRNNGKKMFPGKTKSNIFFIENKNKTNINPNKYVNVNNKNNNKKTNDIYQKENNPNLNSRNINNNTNKQLKSNTSINDNRKRKMSLEIFNFNRLKYNNNLNLSQDDKNNRRKVLYTERSVDSLRPRRILGNFSTREYILNRNNIWNRSQTIDNQNNSITTKEETPLRRYSSFSKNEVQNYNKNHGHHHNHNNLKKENQKKLSKNYYNKFINKEILIGQNNKRPKNKNRKNNNIPPPKELTYIIKKINQDDRLIDINEIKKNFSVNGINIISISGLSNSLVPINDDKVKIILNSNDINSKKFKNIEKYIKDKGLKFDEVNNNFHIKFTRGIYPNNSNWKDITYGGREKFEKSEISSRFEKEQKENRFHKQNILSKTNFYKDVKYKNNFEMKPRRYNSVEKK